MKSALPVLPRRLHLTEDGDFEKWMAPTKDVGMSWVVLSSAFLLQAITIGVCLSSGLFIIEFMEAFNTQQSETSWIASMQIGVAYLIGAPVSGIICERFSHRASVVFGGLFLVAGTFVSSLSINIVSLYWSCGLLSGFGIGLIYSPSISIIGFYFEKRLSLALGIVMAGGGTGAMVFSQIFHWLIQAYLWHGALLITSALVLNCCVLGYVFFPIRRQPIPTVFPLTGKAAKGDMTIYAKSPEQKQLVDMSLFKDYCFVLFFVNSFLFCYGSTAVFFLLADYAIDCHIEKDSAALLLSITGLSSASGRFVMAGMMHCLRCLSALSLYIMAAFICGLAVVLMPAGETFPSFAILCSIFGFTYGGMCSASPVVASELFGAHRLTTVYSYLLVASGIGCLLGSPVAGWLFETVRSYRLPFLINGITIWLSFLAISPVHFSSCCKRPPRSQLQQVTVINIESSGKL